MTALTAARVAPEWAPRTVLRAYPQLASSQIWNGSLVVLTSSGYAKVATSGTLVSGTGTFVCGIAQFSQLAPSTDGAVNIDVHQGVFHFNVDTAFAESAVGNSAYIVDDATVSVTGTNRSLAGTVLAVDALGAWVKVGT